MSARIPDAWRIFSEVWQHRYLLGQLIKRDVLLRYRGAMFGVLWIFLSPLLMLAIYAFIFGQKGLMAGIGIQGSKITKITPGK